MSTLRNFFQWLRNLFTGEAPAAAAQTLAAAEAQPSPQAPPEPEPLEQDQAKARAETEQTPPPESGVETTPSPPTEAEALPSAEEQQAHALESLRSTLKLKELPAGMLTEGIEHKTGESKSHLKLKTREPGEETPPSEEDLAEGTLRAVRNLPQAPAMRWLADNLLQVMRKSDVDLVEVVGAIAKDPAISARILRMANSPVVAAHDRVTDLRTAVSMLGLQRVRITAQALITLQEAANTVDGFNWRHLWLHSYATALLASEIPERLRLEVPKDCYMAGLLHDIGKILLSYINPAEYRKLLMEAICEGTPLRELELKYFGVTHEKAGAAFAEASRLDPSLVAVIGLHDQPGTLSGRDNLMGASLQVANYLAKLHGLGFSGASLTEMPESLGETDGWKILESKAVRPPSAEDFHLQLRPFISGLKQQLHDWARKR